MKIKLASGSFWQFIFSCSKFWFAKILSVLCFFSFQDKVGSWYSNPGTGTQAGAVGGGGVGKYLKARSAPIDSAADDGGLTAIATAKKRKVVVSAGEFKDFSGWWKFPNLVP